MICETPTAIVISCLACFFLAGLLLIFKGVGESPLTNRRLREKLNDERAEYLDKLQTLQWELERATELRAGAEAQAAHFLAQRTELERLERHSISHGFFLGCSDVDRTIWRSPARRAYDPVAAPDLWDIAGSLDLIYRADYVLFVHPSGQVWTMKDRYSTIPTPYIVSEVLR